MFDSLTFLHLNAAVIIYFVIFQYKKKCFKTCITDHEKTETDIASIEDKM